MNSWELNHGWRDKGISLRKGISSKLIFRWKKRIKAIRENAQEKFIELKNKIEKNKAKNNLSMQIEMAEEVIEICTSRYGGNLERLEYASDDKIKEIYRALNNFARELEKLEEKSTELSDKSIWKL